MGIAAGVGQFVRVVEHLEIERQLPASEHLRVVGSPGPGSVDRPRRTDVAVVHRGHLSAWMNWSLLALAGDVNRDGTENPETRTGCSRSLLLYLPLGAVLGGPQSVVVHPRRDGLEEPGRPLGAAGAAVFADLRDDQLLLGIDDENAAGEGAVADGARTEQQVFGTLRVLRSARLQMPDPMQADPLILDETAIGHA